MILALDAALGQVERAIAVTLEHHAQAAGAVARAPPGAAGGVAAACAKSNPIDGQLPTTKIPPTIFHSVLIFMKFLSDIASNRPASIGTRGRKDALLC